MTAVFFVLSVSIITIILWIVFMIRFKKIFSTDDIIASTREEMNRMIADVNRNTERDILLIEDRIKELKAVIADADRHIAIAKSEYEKQARSMQLAGRIADAVSGMRSPSAPVKHAAAQYKKTAKLSGSAQPAYDVSHTGNQTDLEDQQLLFSEQQEMANTNENTNGPVVVVAEQPITPKKEFTEQVHDLYERGESVESIARDLKRSITEVQFALDMGS